MGYTHYWEHPAIDPETWAILMADARRVITATDVRLGDGYGRNVPEVTSEALILNGWEADDEDYETFHLTPGGTGFDFCKTARRPYDAVVGAILLRAEKTVTGFSLRSDGDISGEDWADAWILYARVFAKTTPKMAR